MNRQVLLFVVLIAALGATGFVLFKKYNPATASALVVRNVSDQLLTVQVGNQTPAPLAKDATTQDEFVEGMMVKVWVGEGTKTTSVGWRIFKIRGELAQWKETCITTFMVGGPKQMLPLYADLILG